MTALESLGSPAYELPTFEALAFVLAMLMMWTSRAVVLAWTAQAVEGRLATSAWLTLFVFEVALLAIAWDGFAFVADAGQRWLGLVLPARNNFVYNIWVLLVYGGPFMWFCMAMQRTRRARDVLARAEIERSRTVAILREAQFEALKGHVDPALLLRAISEVRARYVNDLPHAESLLDDVVAFLRQAMPGVRSGCSSILAELDLLRAYTRLVQQLEPGRIGCTVVTANPACDRPFPPLLLLPLVECLQAAQGPEMAPMQVELTADAACLKLTIDCAVATPLLAEALMQRLCRALHALYGDKWRLKIGVSPSMTLRLPFLPTHEETIDER